MSSTPILALFTISALVTAASGPAPVRTGTTSANAGANLAAAPVALTPAAPQRTVRQAGDRRAVGAAGLRSALGEEDGVRGGRLGGGRRDEEEAGENGREDARAVSDHGGGRGCDDGGPRVVRGRPGAFRGLSGALPGGGGAIRLTAAHAPRVEGTREIRLSGSRRP